MAEFIVTGYVNVYANGMISFRVKADDEAAVRAMHEEGDFKESEHRMMDAITDIIDPFDVRFDLKEVRRV